MPFAPGPGAGVLLSGKARQSQRLLQLLQPWAPRLPTPLPFTVPPHSVFQLPHLTSTLPSCCLGVLPQRSGDYTAAGMPQLSGGGGGGDPELCATDEMIPFKDEGDPQKEKIFAEISHPEEEGDLADIKSSLVNESEIIPASNGHEVSGQLSGEAWRVPGTQRGSKQGSRPRWPLSPGPSRAGWGITAPSPWCARV